jgi:penicillin-binding protein-related factor A (putative recombinase)
MSLNAAAATPESVVAQFQRQYWKRQNSIDYAGRHQGPLDDFDERPGE